MSSFRQNQDRNFEPQRYRARSPNLVTAIVLWNTMYLERITWGWSRQVGGRRAAAIPVAAGLGAHQPDWRLRLAAEPQAGGREVQAATIARKTLAYDFFRIQRAPLPSAMPGLHRHSISSTPRPISQKTYWYQCHQPKLQPCPRQTPRSSQPPWPSGDDQASAAQSGGLTGLAVM